MNEQNIIETEPVKRPKSKYKIIILLAIYAVVIFAVVLFRMNYKILIINGNSMEPTYSSGNVVLLDKEAPSANSIIVFKAEDSWASDDKIFIKRIFGKPGDIIKINDGTIYNLTENLQTEVDGEIDYDMFIIPTNSYFVLGDNRESSNDSLKQKVAGNKDYYVSQDSVIATGLDAFNKEVTE